MINGVKAITAKPDLRRRMREQRRAHVEALPDSTRALLFLRPPAPLLELVPDGATIGLYHAGRYEAPTDGYAKFFQERGHDLALPHFLSKTSPMQFRHFNDPYDESDLETGPLGLLQPYDDLYDLVPDVVFAPLLAFTARGERLGQGGGHYDRWLAAHPDTLAIGLAWDAQLVDELPTEPHDYALAAVVTPTRLYGPFDR